jgi:outer membrane protein
MRLRMNPKYAKLILILIILWNHFLFGQGPASDSLTVDQVVKIVLQNNPAIHNAEHGVESSRARVGVSKSPLYPNLTGEASYSRVGPVPELTIPGFGTFALFPENNYDAHLGLHHLLYDFGRRGKSVDLAQAGVKLSQDNLQTVKSDLAYRSIITFYNIIFLQKNIDVVNQEILDLNQHVEVTQKKVKAGTAIEYDVLTTQVRVAGARSQLEEVRNSLQKQKIKLLELMAFPKDTSLLLKGAILISPAFIERDSLISLAEKQRPEYKLALDARTSAGLRRSLAAKGRLPMLNLNLLYGFKNGYIPDLNVLRGNWVAGLQLEVPVFEGFQTRYKKEEAEADYRASGTQVVNTRNMIVSQVQQALSDVQTSLNKLQTSKVQLDQAQEAKNIAERQYTIGVISNLELLDSQTQLTQAHFIYLRAQYDYVISRYALNRAIGHESW